MTRSDFYRLPEWRRVDLKKRFKLFWNIFLFYILDCLSRECFLLYCRCLRVCVCVYHFVSHSILFYVCMRIKLSSATIKKKCSISHSYTLNFLFFVFFSCSVYVCCVRLKKEEKWISLMPYRQREKDNNIIHLEHHLLVLFFWVFFSLSRFFLPFFVVVVVFLPSGKKRELIHEFVRYWSLALACRLQLETKKKLSPPNW
jgi:hypothetical protein